MMEVQQPQQFDWAHDAFTTLNHPSMPLKPEKWASMQNNAFSIPPSLLTQASIESFGQITPPEDSPIKSPLQSARESSIPVEQLQNEAPWLQQSPPQQQDHTEPSPKRRRTSRQTAASQAQSNDGAPPQHENVDPQPPKRKRGRPKSQPQMIEAFTADGFPFQVSSARQSHLEKNRVAAHKCRQRKKEYINGLEDRAREFSSKNKALKENVAMLREEVLELKNEVLRHAGCGFWAVDEYLARCAGDLLGMEVPMQTGGRSMNQTSPLMMDTQQYMNQRHNSYGSVNSSVTEASSANLNDDFGGLELLRDYEEEDIEDNQ
ncbi:hypothetical protein HBH53_164470 [Parastagonospora nodorum]|nr:hypothetical protein HBH53_164470 [Parastagonospora nodorum]KAH4116950.1 hypothetical protein HBH47_159930 [Parastagonospora nodorum]KAH5164245.1 hypothetical protein HBH69_009530 [Parastagonospora nodorum]KAH5223203.1 hypothetical protein HBH77_026410 [Parastagonospora nodorum]KAH5391720.1 hypothetical protein HBI33_020540 [Parastagonospora nodorum]